MKNLNGKWINVLIGGKEKSKKEFEEILATSKSEVLDYPIAHNNPIEYQF